MASTAKAYLSCSLLTFGSQARGGALSESAAAVVIHVSNGIKNLLTNASIYRRSLLGLNAISRSVSGINWGGRIRVKVLNPAMVGLILLDSSLKAVYCNSEALRIFAYPNQPPKAPGAQFSESIGSI